MKKIITFIGVIITIYAGYINSGASNNMILNYWRANGLTVGYWYQSPGVYVNGIDRAKYPNAIPMILEAVNGWKICVDDVYVKYTRGNNDDIEFSVATRNDLNKKGFTYTSGTLGQTIYDSVMKFDVLYNNRHRNIKKLVCAQVSACDDDELLYKKVYYHELGHALGWMNHSPYDTDLMYFENNSPRHFSISVDEKNHLKQIYDNFRYK